MYYLLTKQTPFDSHSLPELIEMVSRGNFPPPRQVVSTLPNALEAICLKAMSLRPEDRFESAGKLASDVQRFLADEPVSAYRESAAQRGRRWTRKHPRTMATVSASLLVGIIGSSLFLYAIARKNKELSQAVQNEMFAREAVAKKYEELAEAKESETQAKLQAIKSRDLAQQLLTRSEKLIYARNLQAAQRYWELGLSKLRSTPSMLAGGITALGTSLFADILQRNHVTLDEDSNGSVPGVLTASV